MTRRLPLIPAVAALLGLAAAPASATVVVDVRTNESRGILITVGGQGSKLRVTAERNSAGQTTNLVVHDESGTPNFEPHGPCQQGVAPFTGTRFVRCSAPNLPFVEFRGGPDSSDNDTLTLTSGSGSCLCDGRAGNDRIVAADGADFIVGGRGNDILRGGPDDDVLEGDGQDVAPGTGGRDNIDGEAGDDVERGGDNDDEFVTGPSPDGADTIDGGGGRDTMDYGSRKARVEARLDGVANDGTRLTLATGSERDNLSATVENVTGGNSGDLLVGSSANNNFFGGRGDDTLRGGDGGDDLDGGLGSDLLRGEGDNDLLLARDAVDDQADAAISCGSGTDDGLAADVRDDDTRALPVDCESASQGMVGEHPNVRIRSARRAGSGILKIRLSCPRRTRRGCSGKLSAGSPRKRARFGPSRRYRIRRGRAKAVRVEVRRPSQARRGAKVRIRSVEKGRLGLRTTFGTLKVRG